MDPYVLSVGASDGSDTVAGWASPGVADFSNSGTTSRHVDVLAPGRSIVSLRDPGSYVDVNHPEGLVSGDTSGRLFRGSGTSQAAAVVSGAVALLLQAYPNLTPDQVKGVLMATAKHVNASAVLAGAGQIDVAAALGAAKAAAAPKAPAATRYIQSWSSSLGQGSLEAARAATTSSTPTTTCSPARSTSKAIPWNPARWEPAEAAGTAWQGGSWNGAVWTGTGWDQSGGLSSARWSSARWSSARWSDADWTSARWSSARWSSARWSDADWTSARWSSARWSGATWG